MDFDHEKCLKLIDLYRERRELWDPTDSYYYRKRKKKKESWIAISKQLGTDVLTVKTKMDSLLASFRRERAKIKNSMTKGQEANYKSNWFAYKNMAFLISKERYSTARNRYKKTNIEEGGFVEEPLEIKQEENDEVTTGDSEVTLDKYMTFCSEPQQELTMPKLEGIIMEKSIEDSQANQSSGERDCCDVYGEYIAMKLKSYDERTRSIVQHLFSNILFETDKGKYKNTTPIDIFPSSRGGQGKMGYLTNTPLLQFPAMSQNNSSNLVVFLG